MNANVQCAADFGRPEKAAIRTAADGPGTQEEIAMSTHYRLLRNIPACDIFDGRLEEFGVREHVAPEATTETSRLLTDGRNYLWVYINDNGFVGELTRYAPNGAPGKILNALANIFDTEIVSEYEPQFWGFETQEEWDAWMKEISQKHEEEFHLELLKYVRGEPNDIRPGTIGMYKAEIAKELIEKDASLLLPVNKDKLSSEIDAIYDSKHAVIVTLSPQDMASVRMLSTHEDDLPGA
jgi:hypothetical protein